MPNIGFKHSLASKMQMCRKRQGRKWSEEVKKKISDSHKKVDPARYRMYDNILTKEYLEREYVQNEKSTRMISMETNIAASTVGRYLKMYNIKRRKNSWKLLKAGISKGWGYTAKFYKKKAFEEYKIKRACHFCGRKNHLCVHHRDKNPWNNEEDNLMVLCGSCHKKIHHVLDNQKVW